MSANRRNLLSVSVVVIILVMLMFPMLTDSSSVTNSTTNATTNNTTIQSTTIQSTTITTAITANTCSTNQFGYGINASGYLSCQYPSENFLIGLVGYWPLDYNLTDTTTPDISGYSNTGILGNSPVFTTGLFGNALNFSSSETQYVQLSSQFSFPLSNSPRTVMSFVYPSSEDNYMVVFAYGTSVSPEGFLLTIPSSTLVACNSYGYDSQFSVSVPIDQWSFLACDYSGSNIMTLYYALDMGQLYQLNNTIAGPINTIKSSYAFIGRSIDLSAPFNGRIDEVRLYNFAFTQTQILEQYNYYKNILYGV